MGCTASTSNIPNTSPSWTSSFQRPFRGAGCLFHNETHALIGIHSRHQKHGHVRMCGFGVKREADEPWWQTAFRETVEELLEPERISFNLYHALASNMSPQRIIYDEETEYVALVFSLADVGTFLRICASYISSPLYRTFPRSLEDLMFGRLVLEDAEIADVVLWPMRERHRLFRVTRDILKDFNAVGSTSDLAADQ
jgi:hypothetical protein